MHRILIATALGWLLGTASSLPVTAGDRANQTYVSKVTTRGSPEAATSGPLFGVNVSGSEYSWSTYPGSSHLDYLAGKGVALIRLPVAWEKIQPSLNGPLNSTEVGKLREFLVLAASYNMKVIVDLHNYGGYNVNWASDAARNHGIVAVTQNPGPNVIGSAAVPVSAYADLWNKLAGALKGHAALIGYDIMNEPHDMDYYLGTPAGSAWPIAAQAAIDAIRSVDDGTTIYVSGDNWGSDFTHINVSDPVNNIIYEAHIYFTNNGSSSYMQTYDQQAAYPDIGVDRIQPFLQWLKANNARGFVGEFAVPQDDPRWLMVLDRFLDALLHNEVSGCYWNYTYPDPSGANSWWPKTSGSDFSMLLNRAPQGPDKPQWRILAKYTNTGAAYPLKERAP